MVGARCGAGLPLMQIKPAGLIGFRLLASERASLEVVMNLLFALAGALFISLFCEKAEAQIAREAFYSIPSETVSALIF